jgi:outer membrane receptor protein involved in Fe transport
VNLQATPSRAGRHTFSQTYNAIGALTQVDDSKVTGDDAWAAEAGGDWEHRLSPDASFKLIGLASGRHTGSSERYSTNFKAGGFRNTFIKRAADSGEYVARGVMSWKPLKDHAIDWGGEIAFNYLDSNLDVRVQTPLATIDATPPVANTRVEEERAEAFVSDVWQPAPGLRIEAGVTVETSIITQSGDGAQERDFTYFKPRIGATWSADSTNQLRFLLERDDGIHWKIRGAGPRSCDRTVQHAIDAGRRTHDATGTNRSGVRDDRQHVRNEGRRHHAWRLHRRLAGREGAIATEGEKHRGL